MPHPRMVSLLLAMLAAGCATVPGPERQHSDAKFICDEAVGTGVGVSRGSARMIADSSARLQISDVRGYLLASGVSRVRKSSGTTTCRPYALGGGLTQCVAVVRLCGR